jgi:hypothetical protein
MESRVKDVDTRNHAQLSQRSLLNAFSACLFSRSLTVAVLYRARKQAVPEHQSRKCCNNAVAKMYCEHTYVWDVLIEVG